MADDGHADAGRPAPGGRRPTRHARAADVPRRARLGVHADRQARPSTPSRSRPGGTAPSSFGARTRTSPEGAIVMPLAEAAERHPELVERHLGSVVARATRRSSRATTRTWTDGAFVYVPAGVTRRGADRRLHRPRAGGQRAALARCSSSSRRAPRPRSGTSRARPPGGLRQRRRRARRRPERATALRRRAGPRRSPPGSSAPSAPTSRATARWTGSRSASARRNGKVCQETQLAGPGAHGSVTGAYATRGRQHLDFDTLQEHAAPDTTSDLAFRGILADRSSAVWRGMIKVDPGAQRTDAFQESRNLLLSKRAHADAIPGLEILANDVRCTHAAAIAQIDPEQLFYLRSHGLPRGRRPAARGRGLPAGARRALRGGPGARRGRRARSSAGSSRSSAPERHRRADGGPARHRAGPTADRGNRDGAARGFAAVRRTARRLRRGPSGPRRGRAPYGRTFWLRWKALSGS